MINGSQPVGGIATWDGTTWSAVGTGPGFTGGPNVFEVHDDGSGERLYAGGGFTAVGGVAAKRAAAWDGVVWTKLGPGPRGNVGALASFEDGGVRTLFVGGDFIAAPSGDSFLAAWGVDSGPVSYCPAGMSASGCFAQLGWFGEPSATASSGFTVSTDSVESSKDGVFFFGTNGRQTVQWGNGTSYRCVVSPVKRAVPMSGLGAPGTCCGFFSMDLNALWCATCPKPAHNPGAGATVQLQLWYRDPQNTSNRTSSFSNAIEFQVSP
jgi:hypothetical protein